MTREINRRARAARSRGHHEPSSGGACPRVSVVIACYNYGHFLTQCVASAMEQPGVAVDVTVVDDASTDDSADVAGRLVQTHGIRLLRHATNAGYISSYNEALALADGEFVIKLDADDTLPRGSIARATALLDAHPEVGFVYGRPFHFTEPDAVPPSRPVLRWQVWSGYTWLDRRCRSGLNCSSNPEVVMRRSVLEQIGYLRPELRHTCDLELWLRLAAVADVGRVQGPFQGATGCTKAACSARSTQGCSPISAAAVTPSRPSSRMHRAI